MIERRNEERERGKEREKERETRLLMITTKRSKRASMKIASMEIIYIFFSFSSYQIKIIISPTLKSLYLLFTTNPLRRDRYAKLYISWIL